MTAYIRDLAPFSTSNAILLKKKISESTHQPLAALHNDELLLRGGPGKDDLCVIPQDVVHLLLRQIFQVRTMDHTGLGIPVCTHIETLIMGL